MNKLRAAAVIIALIFVLTLAGCTDVSPRIVNGVTPPPPPETELPTAAQTVEPTEAPTPTADPSATSPVDALGNEIFSSDHYERYISFNDVYIYEENGETLIDCIAVNSYPKLLILAVNISFFNDAGEVIATSSLQMPDGSFLIALEPGQTRLYSRILTDTVLTDKRFELAFDPETGVKPQ